MRYNNISFIQIVESKGEDINSNEQKTKADMVDAKVVVVFGDGPEIRHNYLKR